MKVQEARSILSAYSGNDLFQEARTMYEKETDYRISLRAAGRPPSRNTIESVVKEMAPWMIKVSEGLGWTNDRTVETLIQMETSGTWVRYKMVDPVVEEYGKRSRLALLRGSPLPLLDALTPQRLDAVSGMMLAQLRQEAKEYLDKDKQ